LSLRRDYIYQLHTNPGHKHRSVFHMHIAYKEEKKTFGGIDDIIVKLASFCRVCVNKIKLMP
jgi:hypothetical protein